MINEKQEILATVNTLPDNTTWDDAVYTLYLHSKLQKSKDDIKNGRVMSIEESKKRMRKKYAKVNLHIAYQVKHAVIKINKLIYPRSLYSCSDIV